MSTGRVVRRYAAHGLHLVVRADCEAQIAGLQAVLAPFAVASDYCADDPFDLQIRTGDPAREIELDPRLPRFWSGRLTNGAEAVRYASGDQHLIDLPEKARLRIDLRAGRADLVVADGCERTTDIGCILPLLCDLFARAGQFLLHAAGVVDSAGRAYCLAGPSGRGKSTAALVLLAAGMRMIADDTCFVGRRRDGEPLTVWGLPRSVKVHLNTLGLLPWLADKPMGPSVLDDERRIQLADLPHADPHSRHAPAAILLMDHRNDRDHGLAPVDRITAVTMLTRQNVRAADARAGGSAAQAFAAIGELVRQTPCYLLSVGPELATLGDRIARLDGPEV